MSPDRSLTIRPAALADIEQHAHSISTHQPDAATRFLNSFFDAADLLRDNPGAGTPIPSDHPRLQSLRKWPIRGFTSFQIFYQLIDDRVDIIRVIHGAEDWPSTFSVLRS